MFTPAEECVLVCCVDGAVPQGFDQQAALQLLLAKETRLLQTLDKLRVNARKETKALATQKLLGHLAQPKTWTLSNGKKARIPLLTAYAHGDLSSSDSSIHEFQKLLLVAQLHFSLWLQARQCTDLKLQLDSLNLCWCYPCPALRFILQVLVHTPTTVHAAELQQLHRGLTLLELSLDERLDVLLHVKWAVKEHDCALSRELVELIDREADLLNRWETVEVVCAALQLDLVLHATCIV
jgi:hypothetical protein